MIKVIKKLGIKAALPLLLLATACGDTTTSASPISGDNGGVTSAGTSQTQGADSSAFAGLSDMLDGADASVPTGSEEGVDLTKVVPTSPAAKPVPEPTALAGLAVAALGLGAIKRKQSA
ncbi:MAG: PEP-CTERM sorting domain-containing protein [Phormidesmis sp.]